MRNVLSIKGTKNKSELLWIRLLPTLYFMFSDIDPQICNYLGKLRGLRQYFWFICFFFFFFGLSLFGTSELVCVCVCVCSSRVPKKKKKKCWRVLGRWSYFYSKLILLPEPQVLPGKGSGCFHRENSAEKKPSSTEQQKSSRNRQEKEATSRFRTEPPSEFSSPHVSCRAPLGRNSCLPFPFSNHHDWDHGWRYCQHFPIVSTRG